jgi:hypothetical protein
MNTPISAAQDEQTLAPQIHVKSYSRYAQVAAGALAATALLSKSAKAVVSPPLTFAQIPGSTADFKVLNYALALEALEADLYVQALQRLTTGGNQNSLGLQINGLGISSSEPDVRYAQLFGRVEREHRDFLNTALGTESLLTKAPFNTAKFDFGMNNRSREQVLDLLYTIEQTGTTAYLGAIPSFETKTYLRVAGGIQATEARHTAVIAAVYNQLFGATTKPIAPAYSENNGIDPLAAPDTVLAAASQFIVLS